MGRRILICLLAWACICVWSVAALPAHAADKIVIRFGHGNAPTELDVFHTAALKMKSKLEDRLGKDRIEVQIYPSGQLGSEERGFQDVQQGIQQMILLAVNNASLFSPSLGAFDLPYIFKNTAEFEKCLDANWELINRLMEKESGNMAIGWVSQGFRLLTNSKKPVAKLADLQGLKIRTPNHPIMIGVYRAWDCEPVSIAWDECFNAVQQKVVDGLDNSLMSFATNRYYEIQKYITDIHYKLWVGPLVVNAAWLRGLPEDARRAVVEAGRETTLEMRALVDKMNADTRKFLEGKQIVFCGTPVDEDEWARRAMAIWPRFYPQIKNLSLAEAFMKTLGRELPR